MTLESFDWVDAHLKMAPGSRRLIAPQDDAPPREAGVLVLIYPDLDDFHVILTRRTDQLRGHSGQVSFPGGRRDPEDDSFTDTALRETCEEIGVCGDALEVIGHLKKVYIPPSHFDVYPTVALAQKPPLIRANPAEVAEVFSLSIIDLLRAELKQKEMRTFRNQPIEIPFYQVNAHKVWGATAVMLSEFEHRLRSVLPDTILAQIDP